MLDTFHELFKTGRVVNGLGLNELSAGFDFLFEFYDLRFDFVGTWCNAAAFEKLGYSVEFVVL